MSDTPLQQRDLDVLNALREDLADCGPGLTRGQLAAIGETRWPERPIRRLREAGYRITSVGTGEEFERFQLLQAESERAGDLTDAGLPGKGKGDQACAPRPVAGSLGARLFELPATPHYDVRAA